MTAEKTSPEDIPTGQEPSVRKLSPAAQRALAEAAERRAEAERKAEKQAAAAPKEVGGRDGPDPARYGDWESRGIASDF